MRGFAVQGFAQPKKVLKKASAVQEIFRPGLKRLPLIFMALGRVQEEVAWGILKEVIGG